MIHDVWITLFHFAPGYLKINKNNVLCIISSKLTFRYVIRTSLYRCHFRKLLELPCDVSPEFMRKWINSLLLLFFASCGTLKLYFKNIVPIDFTEYVKIDVLGTSLKRHNADVTQGRFLLVLGILLEKNLCKYS